MRPLSLLCKVGTWPELAVTEALYCINDLIAVFRVVDRRQYVLLTPDDGQGPPTFVVASRAECSWSDVRASGFRERSPGMGASWGIVGGLERILSVLAVRDSGLGLLEVVVALTGRSTPY